MMVVVGEEEERKILQQNLNPGRLEEINERRWNTIGT